MIDLGGVNPILVEKITRVLAAMAALGYPMKIVQGLRTEAEQAALYAQGRTKPGKIVTKCDGVKSKSRHQARADGLGAAVDCCFVNGEPFGEKQPWKAYGACVEATGAVWGGNADFIAHGINDRPHAELP